MTAALSPMEKNVDLTLNLVKVVISAIAGAGIGVFFRDVVKPWFEQLFYEPLSLKRQWKGILRWEDSGDHEIRVTLNKRGYSVSGRLRFTSGIHKGKEYKLVGRFSHLTLSFIYKPIKKDQISQSSATFILLDETDLLRGCFAYRSKGSTEIGSVPCDLEPA